MSNLGPGLREHYSDQSIRPFVRPRLLFRSISSHTPLTEFGSYFTHRVPLGKRFSVSLNHVSRSKIKIIAELSLKSLSGAYLISLWSNLAHSLSKEYLWSKNVQWHWMRFLSQNQIWQYKTLFFSEHPYQFSSFWLIFQINRSYEKQECGDIGHVFQVECEDHSRIIWKTCSPPLRKSGW